MAERKVRTRFAPSPTGYMHVGNLRTALYAYLTARAHNGKFLLRIEDTDQSRQVEGAIDIIYNTLKETNLLWDEGPDVGGDYGPYIQSERKGLYKEYVDQLIESGHAYRCFCTKERLEEVNKIKAASGQPTGYDRHCRNLSQEEIDANLAAGIPYVVRQKIPEGGKTSFNDMVYGVIEVDNAELDDQVLVKQDGMPTYNFANVVDDHLMEINPVIRGSEYLASTPKYNLLYQAFGWDIPDYVHCPPVMKDAQHKLSKRNGDASYEDLIAAGYLKEAVVNYIALLGWNPQGEQEKFSLEELVKEFDPSRISKSPAIFDMQKLRHLNAEYIRDMSVEQFLETAKPYIAQTVKGDCNLMLLAEVLQKRCEILTDIPEQVDFIDEMPEYDIDMYNNKKMKTNPENSKTSLEAVLPVLEAISEADWTMENIHEKLFALIAQMEVKNGIVLYPLRVALSGKAFTPGGGIELAVILGKEKTISRLKAAIAKLA
ncbi:MAG: glutamate--tRNA ligase [Oscillospiraceae bacterium]|nr:glutamate--tRNA ligase [Oscillospiraceae bacterium]